MRIFPCILLVLLNVALAACSSESGEEISHLVTITNQWSDAANPQHLFNLVADDFEAEGTETGAFSGCELRPTPANQTAFNGCPDGLGLDDIDDYEVTGSWTGNVVTMRTVRPGGTVTFRANVTADHPTTLRFVNAADKSVLVLSRGQ